MECAAVYQCYQETPGAHKSAPTPAPEPTGSILQEAQAIIWGDREQTYGAPDANLRRIASLWTSYMEGRGVKASFTPEDVCWMMVLLKVARQMNATKRDNLVDAAGYIGLIERL